MKETVGAILKNLPNRPGVYLMRDESGEIIYIGKAKSLKKRVPSYFRHNFASPRLRKLVSLICDISIIRTETEAEALIVESKLIKRYQPYFNIDLKMTDRYPYICVTNETFPRIVITRKIPKADGEEVCFGPFVNAGNIKTLLRLVERYFPLRSCRAEIPPEGNRKRACVEHSLGRCMAPCSRLCGVREYRERVDDVILLLSGNSADLVERVRRRMDACAKKTEFEQAARHRDTIRAIWKLSRQRVNSTLQQELDAEKFDVLLSLQKALSLKILPWRIDAFDISHTAGKETYGCCVVFEQGLPNSSLYRRFKIQTGEEGGVKKSDDFAAIHETVSRRYKHVLTGEEPLPQLVLIDGGEVQLEFAARALRELNLDLPIISLAKEEELIFFPDKKTPLRLSHDNGALKLLQRVRDEVHRYSITTHRNARAARLRRSALEDVPGIGRHRAALLLGMFGSARRIAEMTPEEVAKAPGVGLSLAKQILSHLNASSS